MKFSANERRNWGYWDGQSDRERGKFALWCGPSSKGHPFDKPYGEGYWAGRYDMPHPVSGLEREAHLAQLTR